MDLVNPLVEAYARQFTSPETGLLTKIDHDTTASHAHAHMLSGQVQGRFLSFISRLLKPRRILEVGTFTGYSALCLAEGLAADGLLHTIELREEDSRRSQQNFNLSAHRDKIILHTGNALDIIPALKENWDLVFIDADKAGYIAYYELVLPRLRPGGVVLADNVLFHGQVLEQPLAGKNAKAIQAFNEHVRADNRVEQVLLTLRDGIMLIFKK